MWRHLEDLNEGDDFLHKMTLYRLIKKFGKGFHRVYLCENVFEKKNIVFADNEYVCIDNPPPPGRSLSDNPYNEQSPYYYWYEKKRNV